MNFEDVKYFIGIDVAKDTIAVYFSKNDKYIEIPNKPEEFEKYFKKPDDTLVVLETTGGYEYTCLNWLYDHGFSIFQVNNKKFKKYKETVGNGAKTDKIDARMLARYGKAAIIEEEAVQYKPNIYGELKQLLLYSSDLKKTRASEKTKLKSPGMYHVQDLIQKTIEQLDMLIEEIDAKIKAEVEKSEILKERIKTLMQYKGVGEVTALELAVNLPELGRIQSAEIASLCGVAPLARDSGNSHGYRTTKGRGRQNIKSALFIAALSATRYNEKIREFYQHLQKKGKRKMVAIVACMRKMLIHLNAAMREYYAKENFQIPLQKNNDFINLKKESQLSVDTAA